MILIYIENSLIENMIIQDDKLLFSNTDLNDDLYYQYAPVNEYVFNTDSYSQVNLFLFHEDYLGFIKPINHNKFKNECIKQLEAGVTSFRYNGLSVILEEIEDQDIIIKS